MQMNQMHAASQHHQIQFKFVISDNINLHIDLIMAVTMNFSRQK